MQKNTRPTCNDLSYMLHTIWLGSKGVIKLDNDLNSDHKWLLWHTSLTHTTDMMHTNSHWPFPVYPLDWWTRSSWLSPVLTWWSQYDWHPVAMTTVPIWPPECQPGVQLLQWKERVVTYASCNMHVNVKGGLLCSCFAWHGIAARDQVDTAT